MLDTLLLEKAQHGDKEAEEMFIEENMGLVWSIVRKFSGRGYEAEDLFQIGAIGLIKAVKKFDINYGVQFSTYAVPMIMGEIKRFLRDDGLIKVSRSLKEAAIKGYQAQERLRRQFGYEPSINEIAEECKIEADVLIQAFDASVPPDSIYSAVSDKGDRNILDRISSADTEEEVINKVLVENILDSLTPRERQIIVFRYFKGKTQAEIAKLVGVSQVQVSRIERLVLEKLKKRFTM
ncbi:MAG: SigB/SigF/SigG family RNA polymerase sigma factor [Clostridia bacterium]|nr:SigB/SigF/SigG family RNA polymerase sigma factor [Clostridia bacterium]